MKIDNITNATIPIPTIPLSFEFNVTNISFVNTKLDAALPVIEIYDTGLRF